MRAWDVEILPRRFEATPVCNSMDYEESMSDSLMNIVKSDGLVGGIGRIVGKAV